jgi:hypothetical protein
LGGAFVVLFGAVLIVIVLWLVRGGPQRTYRSYYAYFGESVSGVNEDSVRELQRLAQQAEQNPGSLLFGRRPTPGPGE